MLVLRLRPYGALTAALVLACGDATDPDREAPVDAIVVLSQHPRGEPAVLAGETLQLTAILQDSLGVPITGRTLAWSSTDQSLATVSNTGLVTGVAPGFVTIGAGSGGVEGALPIVVLARASSLLPMPSAIGIVPGGQTDLVVGFVDATENPLEPFGRLVDWSSSNPLVATVDPVNPSAPRAVVHGVGPGSVTIAAAGPDASASIPVDVSRPIFTSLSIGIRTACGTTTAGPVYCWGTNIASLLANPVVSGSATPLRVEGLGNLAWTVSAGSTQTCAIRIDDTAYCWGNNSFGQLGNGETDQGNGTSSPVPVSGGMTFSGISSGDGYVCALVGAAAAYCWGGNFNGQLGNGTTDNSSVPVAVAGGRTWWDISVTRGNTSVLLSRHTCGVERGGAGWCWGSNGSGELGDNSTTDRLTPVSISGGLSFTFISAGVLHTCGVTSSNEAYCWGDNSYGQLGSGGSGSLVPAAVAGGFTFDTVSAGFTHSCATTPGGQAYCWGANDVGQLGDGTNNPSSIPVAVAGGLSFTSVLAGNRFSCGITLDQVAYCWGGAELEPGGTGVAGSTVPVKVIGQP